MPSVDTFNALLVANPQPMPEGIKALPGTEVETLAIGHMFSQGAYGEVTTIEKEAATLPAVLASLQSRQASLTHIHFACHGLAELTMPQDSGVLLAGGDRLKVWDLRDPALIYFSRLQLVTLSACQTALPGIQLPDEVEGLPSGWLQAGAKSVLASLWPVSDHTTAALMKKFYELHFLDHLDPVEALWLAQRWLRNVPTWRADCLAAGATLGARGMEAHDIVHDLERAEGHQEHHGKTELAPLRHVGVVSNPALPEQAEQWQGAQHWAAFAVYGA